MRGFIPGAMLACALAAPAVAQNGPVLASAVFLERGGAAERVVQRADTYRKGDRVVLMVEWRAGADGKGFAVTSAVPRTLAYQQSSREEVEVSVDGGRNWGRLGGLSVRDGMEVRQASPQDVTNLRWQVSAREAALGSGRITYSAIVR